MQNFYAPKLLIVNKYLLIIMLVFFLAQTASQLLYHTSLLPFLGLSWVGFKSGWFYTLFTYPLFQMDLMGGLFSALILWYTGSDLEASWGSKRYLQFLLWITLSSGIFFLLFVCTFFSNSLMDQIPLAGSTGLGFGILVVYAMIYPERYFSFFMLFPMKAKHFCMLLGAVQLYTALFSPLAKTTWGHLAAMGFAYIYMAHRQSGGEIWKFWNRFTPNLGKDSQAQKLKDLKKIRHPHLFLVKDDDDSDHNPSKPPKKGGPPSGHWH